MMVLLILLKQREYFLYRKDADLADREGWRVLQSRDPGPRGAASGAARTPTPEVLLSARPALGSIAVFLVLASVGTIPSRCP